MYKLLLQLIKKNRKLVTKWAICLLALFVLFILSSIEQCSSSREEHREIILEETPIEIENVRPKGELYVCSSIVEDYTTYQKTEKHLGILPENHSCVQILRQKCSYMIDLDKIVYEKDTLKRVYVKLPDLEYVATTQNSPFMSDDEGYWIKELPNTNGLKKKVAEQIKKRFDTEDNREKGKIYAKNAVAGLLAKLGYEAVFIDKLNSKRDQ